ncbi:MAG: phage portal protein [Oscillospiraceae bacterium]|nr:phage portal protein [Oscillospiraceae bacterium]
MSSILQDTAQAWPDMHLLQLEENYRHMGLHKRIFGGAPPWDRAKASGLYARGTRRRKLMQAAKVVCDEFSALTFSEQVEITLDHAPYQDYIMRTLNEVGFWKHFPELLSYAYAMGGCSLKVYADDSKPAVDYVQAEHFLPTAWTGDAVQEGVFRTLSYRNGSYYTLLERHGRNANGFATVEHAAFRSSMRDTLGTRCALSEMFPELAEHTVYDHIRMPMFCYFKPGTSNNLEADSPLGLSVFASAIDTLEALDIAFDSFSREFILGRKRIIVPASCIRTVADPLTGEFKRYFDADDEAFMALRCEDEQQLKITDNTVTLRVDEHVSAINALLNILCFQIGFSAGTFSFDAAQGMKTATEVISQDSKTARTIGTNKNLIGEMLEHLVHSLISIGIALGLIPQHEYTVTIGWKDNIIIDDNTLIDNNVKLVEAGLKSRLKAIMEVQKCDEKTAQEELDRMAKEQSVTGLAVDDFLNGGEEDNEAGDAGTEPAAE